MVKFLLWEIKLELWVLAMEWTALGNFTVYIRNANPERRITTKLTKPSRLQRVEVNPFSKKRISI